MVVPVFAAGGCTADNLKGSPASPVQAGTKVTFSADMSCPAGINEVTYIVRGTVVPKGKDLNTGIWDTNGFTFGPGIYDIEVRVTANDDPNGMIPGISYLKGFVVTESGISAQSQTAATAMPQATNTPASDQGRGQATATVSPWPVGTMKFSKTAGEKSCPTSDWVLIVTDLLNIRKQPLLNGEVIAKAPKGNCFRLLQIIPSSEETSGSWFYAADASGGTGYMKNSRAYTMSDQTSFTGKVTLTATPTIVGTPVPATLTAKIVNCPGSFTPKLIVGDYGLSTKNGAPLNLRSGPGQNFDSLGHIANGHEFKVLEGPTCVGEYNWWRVEIENFQYWLAGGDSTTNFVEPSP